MEGTFSCGAAEWIGGDWGGASDVQPRPIRKAAAEGCSPSLRDYLCSCAGRSLREGIRVKIRASTIFTRVPSLAELGVNIL